MIMHLRVLLSLAAAMAVAKTQAQTILAEPAAEPAFLETEELEGLLALI